MGRRIAQIAGLVAASQLLALPGARALEEVEVRILGVETDDRRERLEERLRNASLLNQALEEDVEGGRDILASATADYARMLGALYSEGNYGPQISILLDGQEAAEIDPFDPPDTIRTAEIVVRPNRLFRFGTARVQPRAEEPPLEPVVPGFATGETARADLVGAASTAAVEEWREIGHPKAEVAEQEVIARHPARTLDVDIRLDPGPRLRFGEMSIGGESDVSDRRVRQIAGYPQGEVFSPDLVADTLARLRRTGTFSVATLAEADTPNPDGTLDYRLNLVEALPRRFGLSAEYSTLDGFTLGSFWLHRNLFGGAEQLRIDGQVQNVGGQSEGFDGGSGIDYSVDTRLTRPATFGPDTDAFIFGSLSQEDEPEFREAVASFGLGFSRYFSDRLYAEIAGGLRFSDVSDDFGDRQFQHVIFPSRLEWDLRNDEGDPVRGAYFDLAAQPYIGFAGSETGLQSLIDARGYVSPGERNLVTLAARLQVGSILGTGLEETPPSFLFFSGGSDTVRGQSYETLGVEDDGRDTGGRSFLGLQSEVRGRITDSLGAVVFADIGVVGPNSFVDDEAESHSGVGVGVRYATPIGPLRLDVATPYTGDTDAFSTVAILIGVGQAF